MDGAFRFPPVRDTAVDALLLQRRYRLQKIIGLICRDAKGMKHGSVFHKFSQRRQHGNRFVQRRKKVKQFAPIPFIFLQCVAQRHLPCFPIFVKRSIGSKESKGIGSILCILHQVKIDTIRYLRILPPTFEIVLRTLAGPIKIPVKCPVQFVYALLYPWFVHPFHAGSIGQSLQNSFHILLRNRYVHLPLQEGKQRRRQEYIHKSRCQSVKEQEGRTAGRNILESQKI